MAVLRPVHLLAVLILLVSAALRLPFLDTALLEFGRSS